MYRLHFHRNLRSLAFIALALLLIGLPVGLWWVNRIGLPDSWRTAIERELARNGAYVRVGGLSYVPLRGLVASHVMVFQDASMERVVSRVEKLVVGFDKSKLARGSFDITRLDLRNANLVIPVDDKDPDSETLEIRRLNGTMLLPGQRRFEVRETTGWVEGIEVSIHARLVANNREGVEKSTPKDGGRERKELLAKAVSRLAEWEFDPQDPPQLKLWIEGDLGTPSSLHSRVEFASRSMEKNGVALQDVHCGGEASNGVLTFHEIRASDGLGELGGRVDFDTSKKMGRFEADSSMDLMMLLDGWFGIRNPLPLLVGGRRELRAQGTFRTTESGKLSWEVMGGLRCESVMARGVLFDKLSAKFSWKDGSLFVRDLKLDRPDGQAVGKILVEWPLVRLAVHSSLPTHVGRPFFEGQPLAKVLGDFQERQDAQCLVDLEGGFNGDDRFSWAYTGKVRLRNMDYRGVPLHAVSCDMSLNRDELDFTNGVVRFDYSRYPMRAAFNGPQEAEALVGRIRYRREEKVVDVESVRGGFWPAPLVRLFASGVADSLEGYRFHRPPELAGNGVVDVVKDRGRTRLTVDFRSDSQANYEFLGKDVVLKKPSARVLITDDQVQVRGLECTAFNGPLKGDFTVRNGSQLAAEMNWTQLSLQQVADTYGFQVKGGGEFTGRLEFTMKRGQVGTMNGNGLLGVEQTELFSVPMFGPLSRLISGVLQDRRAGFERAKSAFCNFNIRDGVIETRDFATSTRSLNFAGDGKVDLKDQTIDMTMRMNARGLLGFLTIPLRPLSGMFQFRGTGPIKSPEWEHVMFTAPPKEQEAALKDPPKARVVEP